MSQQTMQALRDCIPTFFILSDENRHKILDLLLNEGSMNVNAITARLHLSRPAVSHHLKLMRDANMVQVTRTGTERHYTATLDESITLMHRMLLSLEQNCGWKPRQQPA